MSTTLTLSDYYSTERAFHDPDPMIRIAAIHHAAPRLARNAPLRAIILAQLSAPESLVARYAALTLTQAGLPEGLRWILNQVKSTVGPLREQLDACLRNCTHFPFAVLLNEAVHLESLAGITAPEYRDLLEGAVTLTAEEFYRIADEDPAFREEFLHAMVQVTGIPGLQPRSGTTCGRGWVLSLPTGKQPGLLCSPQSRLFLKFGEEVALNRDFLQRGRDLLFVGQASGVDATLVYLLEDRQQVRALPAEILTGGSSGGLVAGLVVHKREGERPYAVVLTRDGDLLREYYRPQRAQLGQLALVELETARGRPQCHFVPDIRLDRDGARALLDQHMNLTGDRLGQILAIDPASRRRDGTVECVINLGNSSQFTLRMEAPSPNANVLIHPCGSCSEQGAVTCEACAGQGTIPCHGRYPCSRCNGSGKLQDARDCLICGKTGFVPGCQGRTEMDCPVCSGQGELDCDRCGGTGEDQPRRTCPKCGGSGDFTAPCDRCRGTGEYQPRRTCPKCGGSGDFNVTCKRCGGSGRAGGGTCYGCHGSGEKTFTCTPCEGRGFWEARSCVRCSGGGQVTLQCTACSGQGFWEAKPCNACSSQGTRECYHCHGSQKIRCPACHGEGQHHCRPCNGTGRVRCQECSGQGALLRTVVECDISRPGERP